MKHFTWLIILYTFIQPFTHASFDNVLSRSGMPYYNPPATYFLPDISVDFTHNKYIKQPNRDTCVLSGFNFNILDYRSGRNLHAIIRNNSIEIINDGVQYFKYRIIHYVFSSVDNGQMPAIRIFNERIDYRILEILKHSRQGEKYLFEDIIVVDKSGKRLENEVRSIIIERI